MTSAYEWYNQLNKPFFAPPSSLFSPVWTLLYVLIAISFGYVFWLWWQKRVGWGVTRPFVLNLVFNVLFVPIQFTLRNNGLAFLDIILVLVTIIWAMKVIWPINRRIAYLQVPYLLWVSFATILQLSITLLNL